MKKNKEFVEREIASEYILVPVGATAQQFNGIITLNDTAKFIWKNIENVNSFDELLIRLINEFSVEENIARNELNTFIEQLLEASLIDFTNISLKW